MMIVATPVLSHRVLMWSPSSVLVTSADSLRGGTNIVRHKCYGGQDRSAPMLDGMQEAFECLQIADSNGVPVERDRPHGGERLEASRHVDSNRADHGGDLVFAN